MPVALALNGLRTQHKRELRDEHAQHACPQSLERHAHERCMSEGFKAFAQPYDSDSEYRDALNTAAAGPRGRGGRRVT